MRPGRTLRLAIVAALAAGCAFGASPALAAPSQAPELTPAPADGLTRALASGRLTEAEYALERARSLFSPGSVRARYGSVEPVGPHDATLVLRDLLARVPELSPSQQREARRITARPTDDAVDPVGDAYSVPEAPASPLCTDAHLRPLRRFQRRCAVTDRLEHQRVPRLDRRGRGRAGGGLGQGGGRVRLPRAEIRPDLGEPRAGRKARRLHRRRRRGPPLRLLHLRRPECDPVRATVRDISAYCVLDDDYAANQFPGVTGLDALRVTAAHEFFHAVQAAYDFFDDLVLIEGTAVWMEDEVYDDINDNYQYFAASALERPEVPFDLALSDSSNHLHGFQYGAFVFYRFLTEQLQGPDVIRRTWEFADASPGRARHVLACGCAAPLSSSAVGRSGACSPGFAAANAFPAKFYEEGAHTRRRRCRAASRCRRSAGRGAALRSSTT